MSTDTGDLTERERLTRVVFGCHYDVFPWTDAREAEREDYRRIADAILAAGFGDVTAAKAAALDAAGWSVVEWGVRVGTWPPETYQSRDMAEFYALHPFNGFEEYPHVVVTRTVINGDWVESAEAGGQ